MSLGKPVSFNEIEDSETRVEMRKEVTSKKELPKELFPTPDQPKGGGQKARPKMVTVKLRLPSNVYDLIKEYAADSGESAANWIRAALRRSCRSWDPSINQTKGQQKGKGRKAETLTAQEQWPSGYPKGVGCPFTYGCHQPNDVPSDHDPYEAHRHLIGGGPTSKEWAAIIEQGWKAKRKGKVQP